MNEGVPETVTHYARTVACCAIHRVNDEDTVAHRLVCPEERSRRTAASSEVVTMVPFRVLRRCVPEVCATRYFEVRSG